jgi:purine catabolism regulator
VSAITTLDSPDGFMFFKPGMLAITSGYFLAREDDEAQLGVIANLAARKAAGLATKTRHFADDQIPRHILMAADRQGLPLIQLPDNAPPFNTFTTFFDTSVYCRGISAFVSKEELPVRLIACMKHEGIPALVSKLSEMLGREAVLVFDNHGLSVPAERIDSSFQRCMLKAHDKEHLTPSEEFPGLLGFFGTDDETGDPVAGIGLRFNSKTNSNGTIWLDCSRRAPDDNDAILLKSAFLACEVQNSQIRGYKQEQEHLRAQFIERLLSGQLQPGQQAKLLSSKADWRIPLATQLLVVLCPEKDEMRLDVCQAIRGFFKKKGHPCLIHLKQDTVAVLLPPAFFGQAELLQELRAELQEAFPRDGFVFGVGHSVATIDAHLSYEQACYAVTIGRAMDPAQTIHQFQRLGFYRLSCPHALPNERERFCYDYLGPIIESDKTTSLELMRTLRTFYECQENFSRTGKALYLRPNAVRYRISAIEKACHVDLSDFQDSLNMKTALCMLMIE